MSFTEHDAAGIAILLWSADPGCPERLATPFFHAAAAAAMDMPVEIYFSAASVRLLVPAVAVGLRASSRVEKTIADNLGEAALGARLFACSDALAAQGSAAPDLMPGWWSGGAVQSAARAMDLRRRALVF